MATRTAKILKSESAKGWRWQGATGTLMGSQQCAMGRSFWKTVWESPVKLNVNPPHVPANLTPRYLPKLLSRFSCARLCTTPQTAAPQAPRSLGFSRQEHWSGLPFPSPEFGISRCKLLYIRWANNKPRPYSTGNDIQYLLINDIEKDMEKNIYIYVCMTESLCYTAEINRTL